ncbi:hypothetical protein OAU52_00495 [bacterium]|nr:hypothetical protein [bacterium]
MKREKNPTERGALYVAPLNSDVFVVFWFVVANSIGLLVLASLWGALNPWVAIVVAYLNIELEGVCFGLEGKGLKSMLSLKCHPRLRSLTLLLKNTYFLVSLINLKGFSHFSLLTS